MARVEGAARGRVHAAMGLGQGDREFEAVVGDDGLGWGTTPGKAVAVHGGSDGDVLLLGRLAGRRDGEKAGSVE